MANIFDCVTPAYDLSWLLLIERLSHNSHPISPQQYRSCLYRARTCQECPFRLPARSVKGSFLFPTNTAVRKFVVLVVVQSCRCLAEILLIRETGGRGPLQVVHHAAEATRHNPERAANPEFVTRLAPRRPLLPEFVDLVLKTQAGLAAVETLPLNDENRPREETQMTMTSGTDLSAVTVLPRLKKMSTNFTEFLRKAVAETVNTIRIRCREKTPVSEISRNSLCLSR